MLFVYMCVDRDLLRYEFYESPKFPFSYHRHGAKPFKNIFLSSLGMITAAAFRASVFLKNFKNTSAFLENFNKKQYFTSPESGDFKEIPGTHAQ